MESLRFYFRSLLEKSFYFIHLKTLSENYCWRNCYEQSEHEKLLMLEIKWNFLYFINVSSQFSKTIITLQDIKFKNLFFSPCFFFISKCNMKWCNNSIQFIFFFTSNSLIIWKNKYNSCCYSSLLILINLFSINTEEWSKTSSGCHELHGKWSKKKERKDENR